MARKKKSIVIEEVEDTFEIKKSTTRMTESEKCEQRLKQIAEKRLHKRR